MVCRACGSNAVGSDGICAACGARNAPTHAVVTDLIAPEPTPAPARRGERPGGGDDPSATNPSSGFFCGRCGSAVDPMSDYCGICGSPMNESAMQRTRISLRNSAPLADLATSFEPTGRARIGDDPNDTAPRRGRLSSRMALVLCAVGGTVVISLAIVALIVAHVHP